MKEWLERGGDSDWLMNGPVGRQHLLMPTNGR